MPTKGGAMDVRDQLNARWSSPGVVGHCKTVRTGVGIGVRAYHVLARAGIDRWFEQEARSDDEPVPVRQGRRTQYNALILEPLSTDWPAHELAQLHAALGFVWGPEAVISLVDLMGLDTETAKQTVLRTARWILRSALTDHLAQATVNSDDGA
jgi:hypothetical protein